MGSIWAIALPCLVASAQATDPEARALELFEQSAAAYREGRFTDAAALVEQAYSLHPEPILLYNLARALDAAGDLDGALNAYDRFVTENPDDSHVPLARRRMEVIGEQVHERDARAAEAAALEAAQAESAAAPISEDELRTSTGPDLVAPSIVLTASLLVVGVGAALIGVAVARYDEALTEPVHASAASLEREALTLRDAGVGVLIVGGIATAVGAVWLGVAASSAPVTDARVALDVGLGSLRVHGSF